jgi:3-hydroxyisobutyrate dehydrogenase and related beta-hydroxyacid dehydrogenases
LKIKMIGLIGLGRMGKGIAKNLLNHDLKLNLFNRTKEKLKEFEGKANVFYDIENFVKETKIFLFMLSDYEAVKSVLKFIPKDKIIIDFSTLYPKAVIEIKENYKNYVSSPVFAGPKDIEEEKQDYFW